MLEYNGDTVQQLLQVDDALAAYVAGGAIFEQQTRDLIGGLAQLIGQIGLGRANAAEEKNRTRPKQDGATIDPDLGAMVQHFQWDLVKDNRRLVQLLDQGGVVGFTAWIDARDLLLNIGKSRHTIDKAGKVKT